jgi:transposase-like protein
MVVTKWRHSLPYVPQKGHRAVALRRIYTAPSVDAAERELATFESM